MLQAMLASYGVAFVSYRLGSTGTLLLCENRITCQLMPPTIARTHHCLAVFIAAFTLPKGYELKRREIDRLLLSTKHQVGSRLLKKPTAAKKKA